MKNRIFSLILALVLMFSCSTTVFATSLDAPSPSSTDWVIGGPYVGYTTTSRKTGSFTYGISPAKMRVRVDITVDAPVNMYIQFYNSDGDSLGAASYNITREGTFSWNIPTLEFGPGSYKWEVFFSKDNVYCIYTIYGVTVG